MRQEPPKAKPPAGPAKPGRAEKLAAALRANLGRRRAQKQARQPARVEDEQEQ